MHRMGIGAIDPPDFHFGSPKVHDKAVRQPADLEVVDGLGEMLRGDTLYGFYLDEQTVCDHHIGSVATHRLASKEDLKRNLSLDLKTLLLKRDNQRCRVDGFEKTMPQFIVN